MFNWSISWKRIPLDPLTNLILKKELLKNITTRLHLDRNMRLCTFSWHKIYCRQNRPKYCIVHNVGKLRSPLMLSAYKEGSQVPIRMYWILIKCIKVAFTVFLRLCTQPTSSVWKKRINLKKKSVHCSIVRYEKTEISLLRPRNLQRDESFLHLRSTECSFDECL